MGTVSTKLCVCSPVLCSHTLCPRSVVESVLSWLTSVPAVFPPEFLAAVASNSESLVDVRVHVFRTTTNAGEMRLQTC